MLNSHINFISCQPTSGQAHKSGPCSAPPATASLASSPVWRSVVSCSLTTDSAGTGLVTLCVYQVFLPSKLDLPKWGFAHKWIIPVRVCIWCDNCLRSWTLQWKIAIKGGYIHYYVSTNNKSGLRSRDQHDHSKRAQGHRHILASNFGFTLYIVHLNIRVSS